MAVGGVVETKKIGLSIGTSGTHYNTFFDETDQTIKLLPADTDANGNPVYYNEGHWTSDAIDLQDKFKDYEKVFVDNINNGESSISVETRVSDDGITWDDWLPVLEDGSIQSATKQHIQVKITFKAGFVTDVFLISEFNNESDKDLFDNNAYIDTSDGLKLKRNYQRDMEKDTTWTGEGSLHKKKITRDEWMKIDKLKIKE